MEQAMKLTDVQEFAVQAVISSYVGHEDYDDFFTGMQCGPITNGNFILYVHNEYYANHILANYTAVIALAVWRVIGVEVTSISVAPIDIPAQVRKSMESFLKTHWK